MIPSPVLIVDDEVSHLHALADGLAELEIPVTLKAYGAGSESPSIGSPARTNYRLIFLDLHLLGTSDTSREIVTTAGVLRTLLVKNDGPCVVFLWTKHEEQKDQFEKRFLTSELQADPDNPLLAPLSFHALAKGDFLSGRAEDYRLENPTELADRVRKLLSQEHELRTLFAWEQYAQKGVSLALAELHSVAQQERVTGMTLQHSLRRILRIVGGDEAHGDRVNDEERFFDISEILTGLSVDQSRRSEEFGLAAVELAQLSTLPTSPMEPGESLVGARLNRALHFHIPRDEESMTAQQRGVVAEIPDSVRQAKPGEREKRCRHRSTELKTFQMGPSG